MAMPGRHFLRQDSVNVRVSLRLPGFCNGGNGGQVWYWPSFRWLATLLLSILFLIIIVTFIQSHNLWKHAKAVEDHAKIHGHRKFNLAVATDVQNPSLQYAIVMDCGSSGSRAYVYYWPPHSGQQHQLLNIQLMRDDNLDPAVKKIEPGLSTYGDKPSEASDYLKPLLQFAADQIPPAKHKETPVYIMATAGMRMLPESQQAAILLDIRTDLKKDFSFAFTETQAEVISGKQEGVYAWMALNYALGKFDHSYSGDDPLTIVQVPGADGKTHVRKRTVGVMDMGGGSLQIAFEVPKSEDISKSLLAEFNLGCSDSDLDHQYRVYVSTFLGFGGNAVRKRYEHELVAAFQEWNSFADKNNSFYSESAVRSVKDPCMPPNYEEYLSYDTGKTFLLKGSGDFAECQRSLIPLLNKNITCNKEPCSMNGVFQPDINFGDSEFFGFSEFYYTMEDTLRMSGKYDYMKFYRAAKDYCATPWYILQERFQQSFYPKADAHRLRYQCFKSAWMATVLHDGFKFPRLYKHFRSMMLLDGKEVHWTLGALLYKTRFFPLSNIQKKVSHHYRPPWVIAKLQNASYMLVFCIFIVVAAIFVYLRRLRIVRQPDLRKVPSMSYFMTDIGQMEEGILIDKIYKS